MSLEDNIDQNKEIISKPFLTQNDLILEKNQKDKKNENQFPSSTISSIKNQDLIKNDSLKIIPDFLITNNETNNKCNFFQSKKVTSSEIKENENNITTSEKLCCNCSKTKCIKKYCECFSNNRFCKNCHCVDCKNNPESSSFDMGKEFTETDQVFCTCTKSNCNKKYCECYKSNKKCNDKCRCSNCLNSSYPIFNIKNKDTNSKENNSKENISDNDINNSNELISNKPNIELDENKSNSRKSSLNGEGSENSEESYQIQRISVFISQYQTLVNVEKFTKEDMKLLSKKRVNNK